MLRRLPLLVLAAALAACTSDSDKPVSPDRLRLQIVSGDRQRAQVRPASGSQALVPATPGLSLAQLPANLLPEPLVARITIDGQPLKAVARSGDPLSPSLATLPSDVVVTYRVIEPADRGQRTCGASFVDAAKPDADGVVTTYWERGTYAGECRMEVRLVVDGQPRVDTAFVVEFEPGAPASLGGGVGYHAIAGQPLDLSKPANGFRAHDAHQNPIPDSLVVKWTPNWEFLVAPDPHSNQGSCTNTVHSQGSGWTVPAVPPYRPHGYCLRISFGGPNHAALIGVNPQQE